MGAVPAIGTQPQAQACPVMATRRTLNVNVSGTGPFSYQWRLNGVDIPGATDSSLVLHDLQYANAGLYTVAIGSPVGSVIGGPAAVNVAPVLMNQLTPGGLTLSWAGSFVLQSADTPTGPFVDVPGASSPYVHNTASCTAEVLPAAHHRLHPEHQPPARGPNLD